MPPKASKSKETPAERPILGRFSSHLKIGIVGFPFCTIEPNEARVNVPDEQFEWLCNLYKPKSECPSKDHKDWVLVDQSHIFLHCRQKLLKLLGQFILILRKGSFVLRV
ncbi:Obg-like ATPase 1, partial [Cucurbita argyrosperma subsp. sororia]